jgi:hypothetical protein
MKPDRMAAFEAPRDIEPSRRMRFVKLLRSGGSPVIVSIPASVLAPDLIRYDDKVYIKRTPDSYSEATMWPVIKALDANP